MSYPGPASIESAARMRPSTVMPTPKPSSERVRCGCCNAMREQRGTHPILGPLCVYCARAFDYRLDWLGLTIRETDTCPACADGECAVHEKE